MTPAAFTYGEVCAGVGGLSRGLERGGMTARFHAEIAAHPRRVLAHRWPDVPLLSDLNAISGGRKMRAWMRRHFADLQLLAGGTPCQDLSVAGKRAGIFGLRSSLYFRFVRLWKVLDCPYLLWENVAGALSSNQGADFALVLSAIVGGPVAPPRTGWPRAGVVAGPSGVAAWRLLDAQWFGVPQRRLRLFVLGARAGGVDPAEVLLEPEGVRGNPPTRHEAREGAPRRPGVGVASESGQGWWDAESGVAAPLRADPGGMPSHIAFQESQSGFREDDKFATLDSNYGSRRRNGVLSFGWQNSESQGDDVSQGSDAPLRTGTTPAVLAFDALNNKASYIARTLRGNMDSASGYGGVLCATGEITHALTHEGFDASEDGTGRGTPIIAYNETGHEKWTEELIAGSLNAHEAKEAHTLISAYAADDDLAPTLNGSQRQQGDGAMTATAGIPRRLMPVECERLMDWPDGWTAVPDAKGKPASDAVRYKACGNGVVSSQGEWIGARLVTLHAAMLAGERAA